MNPQPLTRLTSEGPPMLSAKTFRYEVRDHIATITLDRPAAPSPL